MGILKGKRDAVRRPTFYHSGILKLVLVLAGIAILVVVAKANLSGGSAPAVASQTRVPLAMLAEPTSTATPVTTPSPTTSATPSATTSSPPPATLTVTSSPVPEATSTSSPSSMPTATSVVTPTHMPNASPKLGVQTSSANAQTISFAASTGAKWILMTVKWSDIEATPGSYNFTDSDRVLTAAAGAGLTPLIEIRGNPAWAATTVCGPIDKAGGLEAFGAFIRTLVARYSGPNYNLKHWEFYNEPDNTIVDPIGTWLGGCWGSYPADYVAMLEKARSGMDEADASAKIVLGGLAREDIDYNGRQVFNLDFPSQVLDAGGARYIDIMNIHYYSTQAPNWSSYGEDIAGKVEALRRLMKARGVDKPVMVTEVNWTQGFPGAWNTWTGGQVAEFAEMQARYLPKAFARGVADRLYAMTWFALQDFPDSDLPYGLFDINGLPRPAYNAFKTTAAEIGQAAYLRPLSASDVGAAGGVEGYVFVSGDEQRWVLWATGNHVSINLPARVALAKDKLGGSIALSGGGASTNLTLTASPVFVRLR